MSGDENLDIHIEYIKESLSQLKKDVSIIKRDISSTYVSKVEFDARLTPIRNIVYGGVGVALLTILGAILKGVMK